MRRWCLGLLCLTLSVLLTPATGSARVPSEQLVVVVFANHAVSARPDGRRIATLNARRPITDSRTVVPVLSQRADEAGRVWLRVRLPGRVTGVPAPPATGWISAAHTELRTTPWHIIVDLKAHELIVYRDARAVRRFSAIVGKPSTPTPSGQYFVEEDVTLSQGQPGGPFALATSDRSDVLHEFDGGPGQIAIHGLARLGGSLGTAESHGCVRLSDRSIRWLASRIGAGTPVTIH
jgi:hypothetical protein